MMVADRAPIRVVGRYALYNEIAAGGMATIHLGRLLGPVGFARTVAVKRLHPQFAKDPEFVSMFLDEARLAARVQHPNVVATIDVVATDGELFLIMDYVRGESLSKILRTVRRNGQRVPPKIASAIMCGFLHGLHSAHEAKNERGEPLGLVHRDVSPQNVLVGSDGIARVLDFGIAKAAGRIQVTRDGQIKGKLAYMPPEQLAGKDLTRAVDIYASGVVMWETLTAERLFKGDTEGETLAKILRDPILPPSSIVPSLPKGFDAPLLKALSRESNKRQATAKELALELERCCGIASPTEVGEWVESIVGPVLNAREEQIAAIESNSVGLRISPSGRPGASPESIESDTDMSLPLPSSRALRLATGQPAIGQSQVDTIPMGSGPPTPQSMRMGPPTPVTPMIVQGPPQAPLPHPPYGTDEGTGTKAALTGTMLGLPVDRKLPVLASIAGLIVLFAVVAVVLGGKYSRDSDAKVNAAASASSVRSTSVEPSVTASATAEHVEPPPAETASAAEPAPPSDDTKTTGNSAPPAAHSKPGGAVPHPQGRSPATPPKPSATAPAPPPPPAKKNCDPPYTLDAQGRKKYKLECL